MSFFTFEFESQLGGVRCLFFVSLATCKMLSIAVNGSLRCFYSLDCLSSVLNYWTYSKNVLQKVGWYLSLFDSKTRSAAWYVVFLVYFPKHQPLKRVWVAPLTVLCVRAKLSKMLHWSTHGLYPCWRLQKNAGRLLNVLWILEWFPKSRRRNYRC